VKVPVPRIHPLRPRIPSSVAQDVLAWMFLTGAALDRDELPSRRCDAATLEHLYD